MALTAQRPALTPAGPFLKWAGGKTQLLPEILPRLPARMNTYYEPFIGGGAVFFALAREGRFKQAVLSDRNAGLIETYTVVRDYLPALIDELEEHQRFATDADYYYEVRALATAGLNPVQRAARMIFLNKTCFNGLYRVNKRGLFNVPFGKYAKPRVLNEAALTAASGALQGVQLLVSDFKTVASQARAGDTVYFDPPYVPLSSSSSFTAYHNSPFGPKEHAQLASLARECMERGVNTLLSNSDCPETRALYEGLRFTSVQASRAINAKASGRGRISELLVTGLTRETVQAQGRFESSLPTPALAQGPRFDSSLPSPALA